ncbi:MAG: helix-turn-helix transcriptional regulator [Thiothrix sp.]|uniref:helix-turn-helix domain-containing protein n=1 Tax=Thiothrix sp. TaxID=1032 RepID=UPI00262F6CE7|nr:helix-turn-helix transcriptional regulator [Thiothrix sp.]MDD5394588.1 helix-turn-helix transcriptional regulator [Thiothrix sp.]
MKFNSDTKKEPDAEAIGQRLREVRTSAGLTQVEFAEKLGVERQSVLRCEAGKRLPDAVMLLSLRQEFGTNLGWLLDGEDAEECNQIDTSAIATDLEMLKDARSYLERVIANLEKGKG